MADELTKKRIINLPAESAPAPGDVFVVDNESTGTKKLPVSALAADPSVIEQAVTDWLDEHPEATTTVQDWSLTADKFVKGQLGFITPEMFGAVGDGITDDTDAIIDAIEYGMANKCKVFFPAGTYIISPKQIEIGFTGNDSLEMCGVGKESCIKRKDESLDERWDWLFQINNGDATDNSNLLYIHDLYIDSNRRNQSNATDGYEYEASADFMMYFNNETYHLDTAIFENLWFYDGVADHLDFTRSGVVHMKDIVINKVFAWGRQGTRNDIDFPAIPMGNVYISNVSCQKLHAEYNGTPTDPQYFFLNNIHCTEFSFGGKYQNLKAVNMIVENTFVYTGETDAVFTNCEFNLRNRAYLYSPAGIAKVKFNKCTFNSYDTSDGEAVETIGISSYCYTLKLRPFLNVVFSICTFDYKGSQTIVEGTPFICQYLGAEEVANAENNVIIFDGCEISKKFKYGLHFYGCGIGIVRNMVIKNQIALFTETTYGKMDLTFENVSVRGTNTAHVGEINNIKPDTAVFRGEIKCEPSNINFYSVHSNFYANAIYKMKRIVEVTEPLTTSLVTTLFQRGASNYRIICKGDEIRYIGANRELYPEKWICNDTGSFSSSNTNASKFLSVGTGQGTTANRPTCYLSNGFQFFDTDLGKTICWNGTEWVNVDGTALT